MRATEALSGTGVSTAVLDRRQVIQAGALIAAVGFQSTVSAAARSSERLFDGTSLADNPVAMRFERLPAGVMVPAVRLTSIAAAEHLDAVRAPATLISLWADWCAPCLSEMHDLRDLGRRHAKSGFAVLALLQGSRLDAKGARAKLDAVGAAGLASWIEPEGATMVTELGTPVGAKGFSLPCNLLVDRHGRVRGRAFGSNVLSKVAMKDGHITAEGKEQLQHVRTGWSLPAADRFADALSGGLLEQV